LFQTPLILNPTLAGTDTVSETSWISLCSILIRFLKSVASVHGFILAMLLHPEIQKKCQAEIDTVCNNERLPDIADRDQFPYLSATMKELMRWQPVSPLGRFHTFHLHL
jgi:hypothetical protein